MANTVTSFIINGEIVTIGTYTTLVAKAVTLSSGARTLTSTGGTVSLVWNFGYTIQGDNTVMTLNNDTVRTNLSKISTNTYSVPKGATSAVFYFSGGDTLTAASAVVTGSITDNYFDTVIA